MLDFQKKISAVPKVFKNFSIKNFFAEITEIVKPKSNYAYNKKNFLGYFFFGTGRHFWKFYRQSIFFTEIAAIDEPKSNYEYNCSYMLHP